MRHNEHVLAWLGALRDEAVKPECDLERVVEIFGIVARYAALGV